METPKVTFVNELGNEIRIEVADDPDALGYPGVCILMEGPSSTCENMITLQETRELHGALTAFLKQEKK
jgi:hypothetical protein